MIYIYRILFANIFFWGSVCMFVSCNENPDRPTDRKREKSYSPVTRNNKNVTSMVLCPMCMGNGKIRHYYYTNKIMICPTCEGNKQVSIEMVKQLNEAERMGREWAEKVMGISGEGTSPEYSGQMGETGMGGSRQLIESQIGMLERQIAMYEQGLANSENITLQSLYRNTITELQYQIRNLKMQLQNME